MASSVTIADTVARLKLADMRTRGFAVFWTEDDSTVYTIGLSLHFQPPEILVAAPFAMGVALVYTCAYHVLAGTRYTPGLITALRGSEPGASQYCPVLPQHKQRLAMVCQLLHTDDFPALQMLMTDDNGNWPWDPACDPFVR